MTNDDTANEAKPPRARARNSRHNSGDRETVETDVSEKSPEGVIKEAIEELNQGLLPKIIIREALQAIKESKFQNFFECALRIYHARAFQPSDTDLLQMHFLAERAEARMVSESLLRYGLSMYPDSSALKTAHLSMLAHSSKKDERQEATKELRLILNLDENVDQFDQANLAKAGGRTDLLGMLLDALHRDGEDEQAFNIIKALHDHFPDNSMVLRNYARSIEKTKAASIDTLAIYKKSITCHDADDTSAMWYASSLVHENRLIDVVEVLSLACLLDLDEANSFATLASAIAEVMQPRNCNVASTFDRKMPDEFCNERFVAHCIAVGMSCQNWAIQHQYMAESAALQIGLVPEFINEIRSTEGPFSRMSRKNLILPLYNHLESAVTTKK